MTIAIKKVLEAGPAISTRVKLCMVSITHRSAFVCRTFPYTKSWADPASVPAGPAGEDPLSPS